MPLDKAQSLSDAMGIPITEWYMEIVKGPQARSGIDHGDGAAHVTIRGVVHSDKPKR